MAKELSEKMQEVVQNSINKNESYLQNAIALRDEYSGFGLEVETYKSKLIEIYSQLDEAHSMLMQGEYADYYTVHLNPAKTPAVSGPYEISREYCKISTYNKDIFLKEMPDKGRVIDRMNTLNSKLKQLIDDFASTNAFIIRLEGMDNINSEIESLISENWSYPVKDVQREILDNKQFISPRSLYGMQNVNPFHIQMYLSYMPVFNTFLLLRSKSYNLVTLIRKVNSSLPFAELKDKPPLIQNNVNGIDKSVKIDEGVSIGENNAIGDYAKVDV